MIVLRRLNDVLERTALAAVVVMMAAMSVVIFAQAAGRYALDFSLTWSEELARFLMVWVSMLGGAVAARRRLHVGFEALVGLLPARLARTVRVAGLGIALGVFGVMGWYGFVLARFNMRQSSAALEWPMGVPYAAVPVGSALLVLFLLEALLATLAAPAGAAPDQEVGGWF